MAGVWSSWKNPKIGQREPTFVILTGEANGVMRTVHDRQPAILEPSDYRVWLSESERPPIHLLRLLPGDEMESKLVDPTIGITPEQAALFNSL